jgi:putative flippase GtrA
MLSQLVRFGLVGMLGSLVNLAVFSLFVKVLHLDPNVGATAAFLVAVTQNFTLNRLWTFRVAGRDHVAYVSGWGKYLAINLVGFGVNLVVLNSVLAWAGREHSLEGQAAGILLGMVFNFALAKLVVFSRSSRRRQ